MSDADLTARYNYAEFTRANVLPLLRFAESPPIGERAPDYPLWDLTGHQTSLAERWAAHDYTVVEFGSFT